MTPPLTEGESPTEMDSGRFRTSESHPFHRKVKGLRLQPWECQKQAQQ